MPLLLDGSRTDSVLGHPAVQALEDSRLHAKCITIEITEPGAVTNFVMSNTVILSNIRNYQELLVCECVMKLAEKFPSISEDAGRLEDVACIALNALRPRYVRQLVNLQHHMSEDQRDTFEREASSAVLAAFEFVLFKP